MKSRHYTRGTGTTIQTSYCTWMIFTLDAEGLELLRFNVSIDHLQPLRLILYLLWTGRRGGRYTTNTSRKNVKPPEVLCPPSSIVSSWPGLLLQRFSCPGEAAIKQVTTCSLGALSPACHYFLAIENAAALYFYVTFHRSSINLHIQWRSFLYFS